VGCGTGYFTRMLAEYSAARVTGIDIDTDFIQTANRIKEEKQIKNLTFCEGDACRLPFEDNRFDTVVSHTFFHSVPDPVAAIQEMKRVCKPFGIIGTLSPLDFTHFPADPGHYPAECTWYERLRALEEKKMAMYEQLAPVSDYINKLPPIQLPYFFHKAGLMNVSVYPVGQAVSLSNHALPEEEKAEYIRLMYRAETAKLDSFMRLTENVFFTTEDYRDYMDVFKQHTDYLLASNGENGIWEIRGGCFMAVAGTVPMRLGFLKSGG
jgi:SAM-dependent methyltransferase